MNPQENYTHSSNSKNNTQVKYSSLAEYQFASAFEYSAIGMALISPEGKWLRVNNRVCEIVGYSKDELMNLTFQDITHPEDLDLDLRYVKQLLSGDIDTYEMEKRYISKTNDTIWVLLSVSLVKDKIGKPIHFISQIQNITDRKKTEEQLKLLNSAVESSSVSIAITNADGIIIYINPWFSKVTGYSYNDIAGTKLRIFNNEKLSQHKIKELWNAINSGQNWSGEYQNRKKNGEHFWEHTLISPIYNNQNKLINIISISQDITEKKQIVKYMVDASIRAKESELLKSAFLSNIRHEIRTPMSSILGFSEMLSDADFNKDDREGLVKEIQKGGERLINTINNIIEISIIDSGIDYIRKVETDVISILHQLIHSFERYAQSKGLEIKLELECADKKINILTDPEKLEIILKNIIDNAIKFTDKGSITVGCYHNTEEIEFYIKDTGVGIHEDRHNQIFNKFEHSDLSNTRAHEGIGLGLSIAKFYVEILKGKIWLQSQPGIGSTFFFTLPL